MVTTTSDSAHTDLAFLQRRTATYGLAGAGIGWFFFAARLVEAALGADTRAYLTHPSMLFHLLGAVSFQLIWLLLRGQERSVEFIRGVETVGTFVACTFYAIMAMSIPLIDRPQMIVVIALSFGMFARAVYVPSSARRTALVTAISGLPLLAVTFHLYRDFDVALWQQVAPSLDETSSIGVATTLTVWTAVQLTCMTAICAGASNVVYGLRKEVRDVKRLGQYTLVEKLGEGGMGMVYRAQHAMLRRPTAVKLLPVEKAGEQSIARFEKEVQLTAMLTHPNTVTIFDYGRTPDGVFYYAMEYLNGATLAAVVEASGPMPPARAVRVLCQAASALTEAHAVNLIHRDIKPTNIMLVEQGGQPDTTKVVDFGLVKELARDDDVSVTKADAITGTPQYLSPEAITSSDGVDARSDIYALGAVGYYLLTGTHVFDGNTVIEVCSAHLHETPVSVSERLGAPVSEQLESVILRCLEKNPEDRPQSATELRAALQRCAGIGEWTEQDARTWWAQHGEGISASRDRDSTMASGLTVDIDLARRRGAA